MKWVKYWTKIGFGLLLFPIGCVTTAHTRSMLSKGHQTTVIGEELQDARSLPPFGKGYRTYSYFGSALGRQYAHHKVIATLENAFANLHESTG